MKWTPGVSALTLPDGAMLALFDGFRMRYLGTVGMSDERRRVKPLRGSCAALRPVG